MKRNYPFFFCKWILYVLIGFFFFSCDKEDKVGANVISTQSKPVIYTDSSVNITGFTVKEDTLRTDELSRNLLGSYNDPVFGNATASFFTQFRLSSVNVNFGTAPVIDSIVLMLDYAGFYGDSSSQLDIKVYELTEDMQKDSNYFSNKNIAYNVTEVGQKTLIPNLIDSVEVNGSKLEPHLRITLQNSFGQKFLDESGSTNLADNESFLKFFKGVYVSVNNSFAQGEGVILYFDLESSLSEMVLYYHDDTTSNTYEFEINDKCARFTNFEHDYSGSETEQFLSDSSLGSIKMMVQAMAGVKTILKFDDFKNAYSGKQIAINKAEIMVSIYDDSDLNYEPLSTLILVSVDESFKNDQTLSIASYDENNKTYTFNVTNYIQNYTNKDFIEYGMAIIAGGGATVAGRTVLKGNSDIKLNLLYTEIK